MVRGVTASAIWRGSMFSVRGSMSTKTGSAPTRLIASAVAKNVNGSRDDLVAVTDAQRPQADHQCVGPRIARDRVFDGQETGHLLFKGVHLRTKDELSRPHHVGDGRLDFVPEQVNFGGEVEGRDLRRIHA